MNQEIEREQFQRLAEKTDRQESRRLLRQKPEKYFWRFLYYELKLRFKVNETERLLAKYCYLLLRYVDDVADGDHKSYKDNEELQATELRSIQAYLLHPDPEVHIYISGLYQTILQLFEDKDEQSEKKMPIEEIQKLFADAVKYIIDDFERKSLDSFNHELTKRELYQHFYNMFKASVNLLDYGLGREDVAVGNEMRFNDETNEPELEGMEWFCYLQGQFYAIRDFHIDWKRGVINLPIEVMEEAGITSETPYIQVATNEIVKKYFLGQITNMKEPLKELKARVAEIAHSEARYMCEKVIENLEAVVAEFVPRLENYKFYQPEK